MMKGLPLGSPPFVGGELPCVLSDQTLAHYSSIKIGAVAIRIETHAVSRLPRPPSRLCSD